MQWIGDYRGGREIEYDIPYFLLSFNKPIKSLILSNLNNLLSTPNFTILNALNILFNLNKSTFAIILSVKLIFKIEILFSSKLRSQD